METTDTQVHCPKCGSTSLTAAKKGFSGKKAVAGAVLTGGIGLLAGTIGSNKLLITCLNCGNQFKPGEGNSTARAAGPKLIWDEKAKKHIVNPQYNNPVKTISMPALIGIIVLFIIILYFLLR